MKHAVAILVLLLIFQSCGEAPQNVLEPIDAQQDMYGYDSDDADMCHGNMLALGEGVKQFFGKFNRYPDSLAELEEIDPALCDLACPSCSLSYLYESDGYDNYTISCPYPCEPDHGFYMNGVPFWPLDPSLWAAFCHANMRSLASACAMYYGKYNVYPSELDDLIQEGFIPFELKCPECNQPYLYSSEDLETTYLIRCPVPVDPNHGYVEDGVCHWPPDPPFAGECRSQMRALASGMAMFYGKENRYPYHLSELGTSGIMENWDDPCPACGEIYEYSTDPQCTTYVVRCPAPIDPVHGSVVDGIVSWQ
jgi:hypothetical protein